MNAHHCPRSAVLAFLLILSVLGPSLSAKETFKARMLTGKSSFESPQINVKIEVENWTTPEEVNRLQEAMNRGYNAFESAFTAEKKGIARFMSSRGLGVTIHAAFSTPTEKGRRILLFFNQQVWDAGMTFVSSGGRSRFMVMDITLDEEGGGSGHFYEFAQIRLRADLGTIEMEAFESAPKIFPLVQDTTKKK